jgi:hypothetical protein
MKNYKLKKGGLTHDAMSFCFFDFKFINGGILIIFLFIPLGVEEKF